MRKMKRSNFIVMTWSGEDEVFIKEKWSNFLQFFCKKTNKTCIYPLGGICKKKLQIPPNSYYIIAIGIELGGFCKKIAENPSPRPTAGPDRDPTTIIVVRLREPG